MATLVDPPRQKYHEVVPFDPNEIKAILSAAEESRYAAAMRLALTLGLRQGEVLGLQWVDVDLDSEVLHVRHALQRIDGKLILKEPKTEKSRRTLKLPRSAVTAMNVHRQRQESAWTAAGTRWQETGYVFTTNVGTPVDPRNLIREWKAILAKAGVVHRPFHTSRHTAASLLFSQNQSPKVVQEWMGHSMLSATADIYGHLFPQAFSEAADAIERALSDDPAQSPIEKGRLQ